jgi:hypothetical protein
VRTWLRGVRVAAGAGLTWAALPSMVTAQISSLELEVEGGLVWQSRNDVEVPNDGTATRFSLSGLVGTGPWAAGRVYLTWHLSKRHEVRLLYAPLSLTASGSPNEPITFAGANYLARTLVAATYTFNSYRASYRWRLHSGDRSTVWVGFTAKVRDATIALAQGSTRSRKDDLGFVPLLHLAGDRRFGTRWHLSFDADGLAGGPGRAIDASLKLGYDVDKRWSIRAGYRTVEGGADVESVYAFAWLHYAAASVVWRL